MCIRDSLRTGGVVTATGNITGGNLLTGGVINATGNGTFANVNTAIISASGNVTGANVLTGGLVSATGNVSGGNVNVTANILGSNITANTSLVLGGSLRGPQVTKTGSSTGTAGQICWDNNYIYVCTATNVWKRASLTSF